MDGPLLHPPASKAPRPPLLSPLHPSHGSWSPPGRSQSAPSARDTPGTVPRPHRHADTPPVPCTDPISPLVALRRRASAMRVPACPGFTPCGPVPQRRGQQVACAGPLGPLPHPRHLSRPHLGPCTARGHPRGHACIADASAMPSREGKSSPFALVSALAAG